jgi:hypothetical protein
MTNKWDELRSQRNPFVKSALLIINCDNPDGCCPTLSELAAALAEDEPMLSPLNLECAAREALRREPDYREAIAKAEELRLAEAPREAEALQEAEALREAEAADDYDDTSELAA